MTLAMFVYLPCLLLLLCLFVCLFTRRGCAGMTVERSACQLASLPFTTHHRARLPTQTFFLFSKYRCFNFHSGSNNYMCRTKKCSKTYFKLSVEAFFAHLLRERIWPEQARRFSFFLRCCCLSLLPA